MRMRFGRGTISALVLGGVVALVMIPGEGTVDSAVAESLASPPAEAEMIATLREWAKPTTPVEFVQVRAEPEPAPQTLLVAEATPEPVAEPEPERLVVAADVLNMRDGASSGSAVVDRLAGGTAVELVGTEGEWRQVRTAAGTTGWVHANFVSSQSL
ncbi:SH3 domain-containing protein [Arsenicitalea aurantiaca]|uniref:SH3 domain-containing protein n=1 Tax=Arsenicitalea aurantiaca TaxID=1783274 RepID=A0A433XL90_9HYPH|nr:SH3 domain-containing protein [Arsenicitalea aurantiaca]RUT34845.1 SH3 domain-containing protein [Arsenicitalea aurantiaca]